MDKTFRKKLRFTPCKADLATKRQELQEKYKKIKAYRKSV